MVSETRHADSPSHQAGTPPALVLDEHREPDTNLPSRQVAPIVWAMDDDRRRRLRDAAGPCTDVVALWNCPVCERAVPRWRRPGRHAVYCSNSCKQKAYRHRCIERNRRMLELARNPRPQRASTRDGVHAIRETTDRSTGRRDSIGHGITMCGAFASMSIDTPARFSHRRFLATSGPSAGRTCKRCVELSSSPIRELDDVITAIVRRQSPPPNHYDAA